MDRPLLIVSGLAREMKFAAGPSALAIGSGGDAARLRALLHDRRGHPHSAVLSFGIAGGLDSALRPGDMVVATAIVEGEHRWPAHPDFAERLHKALAAGGLSVSLGELVGSETPLVTRADKRELHERTAAAAVDMESHVAAEFANAGGLPFAAIRVVCDPAERTLPAFAAHAIRPDGGIAYLTILRSLAKDPAQLAALPRLARDASAAFASLRRCRDLLRVGRGLPDFREFLRHVP